MKDDATADLYERHAHHFDRERSRSLQERLWLRRFLSHVRPRGTVLDVGCGMGEPLGKYIIESGFSLVGVDTSPTLIEMCWTRFAGSEWLVADMRELVLDRQFDGILAWDSLFHLNMDDQRRMFPRFARHAASGAPLMFTAGPLEGESIGSYRGEPLYHASLDPSEYEHLLAVNGFVVRAFTPNDPTCGEHTVWLATRDVDHGAES